MHLKLFDLIEEFQYVRDSVEEIGSKLIANRTGVTAAQKISVSGF